MPSGAEDAAVGAIEDGVGRRQPFGISRKGRSAGVDTLGLQLPFGGFFLGHRDQVEFSFRWHDRDLDERLARAEDVGLSLGRGLEDEEEDHRPPGLDDGRYGNRGGAGCVGVETWVGFGLEGPSVLYLQVDQALVGVVFLAEGAERGALVLREVAFEAEGAVLRGNAEFVVVRVGKLDARAGGLGERDAVPGVFVGAVCAWFGLAGPSGDFQFGPARVEVGVDGAVFNGWHGGCLLADDRVGG